MLTDPDEFEVEGNNGGSYVRITSLGKGMCRIAVGETCVTTINMDMSVSALAAILTWANDRGFQKILDEYSGNRGGGFKVDQDHWTC